MSTRLALAALVLAATPLVSSCAKKAAPVAGDEPVTIVVDNQNFYDATVYLRWYSDRRRLGNVVGYTKKEFETRWVGPEVQVEVDLLAGGTYRGDRISVSPGETIEVDLPPSLNRLNSRISGPVPPLP